MNILKWLEKYRYPLILGAFAMWVLFFDSYNLLFMKKQFAYLKKLEKREAFYKNEIVKLKNQREQIFGNQENLERFAREKYYFSREGEDVYIIE